MIGVYIWIPFVGTFLGAACVLFMTGELKPLVQKSLLHPESWWQRRYGRY